MTQGVPPDEGEVTVGVVKFKSPDGALQARDWMHGQDLQQPCFAVCISDSRNLPIPGVPTASAVQQIPGISSANDGGQVPPTHYLVEFTVGSCLCFASTDGSPKDAKNVVAATRLYCRHEEELPG